MIVHVFNERIYYTQDLSSKIGGMYPIYIDGEIAANIIANNDNWTIKLSNKFSSKEVYYEQPRLEPYKIYTIKAKYSGEVFHLVATPRYNPKMQAYDILIGQITIGSDEKCDVYYPLEFSDKEALRISLVDSRWIAQTNSPNFFVKCTGGEIVTEITISVL